MIEKRFADLEYRAERGEVHGIVVRYGDEATLQTSRGIFKERIHPGAFEIHDTILNIQHDRQRIVARTGGGGLFLEDGPKHLALTCELPNTTEARDAKEMLDRRILRGLSVEMKIPPGGSTFDYSTRTRDIRRAELHGIGLVDRPAYADSEVLMRFEEDRAKSVKAGYRYGQTETISDKGRNRKRKIKTGAFQVSIDDPRQEITLSIGRNPNEAIASKLAGTLILKHVKNTLEIEVRNPPDTAAMRDLEARRAAGMDVHVEPLFRELDGEFVDVPEPGNPDVLIREYAAAKLYGLSMAVREPKGAVSEVEIRGNLWQNLKVY